MQPQKKAEFRERLLAYTQVIPEQDATTLLNAVDEMEAWIDRYVNQEVSAAIAPFIKVTSKNLR